MKKSKTQKKSAHQVSPAVKPLFYRSKDLSKLLSISRTTVWRLQQRGILPPPTKISWSIAGWPAAVIEALIASPVADDE